jgi:hypothetical protein
VATFEIRSASPQRRPAGSPARRRREVIAAFRANTEYSYMKGETPQWTADEV